MDSTYVAFLDMREIASGDLESVAIALRQHVDAASDDVRGRPVLVFDTSTGRQLDLDLSGPVDAVAARHRTGLSEAPPKRGRGRPRLGVVGREVTLLPRHWAWLDAQPQGASPTLRRLIDKQRRGEDDPVRRAQHRAHGFMTAVAGDLPGYEEAIRALYAGSGDRFRAEIDGWPEDVRRTTIAFAEAAIPITEAAEER